MNLFEARLRSLINSVDFENRAVYLCNLVMYCFLAGISNVCGQTAGHPFDMMKIRLQLQSSEAPALYKNTLHGLQRIGREEGRLGVYRGWQAAILREYVYSGMRLGLYEPFKVALGATDPAHTPLATKVAAGSLAGCVAATLTNVLDVVKVVQASPPCAEAPMRAAQPPPSTAISSPPTPPHIVSTTPPTTPHARLPPHPHLPYHLHPFRHIAWMYAAGGVRGLFVGLGPNVTRGVVVNSAQVPSYDQCKHTLLNHKLMGEGVGLHVVSSMVASLVAVGVTNPIDVVKTRVMGGGAVGRLGGGTAPSSSGRSSNSASLPLRASSLRMFTHIARVEGVRGLYSGAFASWLRLGPHTMTTFVVFEGLRKGAGVSPM